MIRHISFLIVTLMLLSVTSFGQSQKYVQHKMDKAPRIVTGIDDQPSFYSDFKMRQAAINRMQNPSGTTAVDLIVENYDWLSNSYMPPQLLGYDFTGDGVFDPFAITTGNTLLTSTGTAQRYAVVGFVDDFGVSTYLPYGLDAGGFAVRTGWNSHVFYNEANPDGKVYLAIYDFLRTPSAIKDFVYEVDLLSDPTTVTKLTTEEGALAGGWARFAIDGNGTFWEVVDNASAFPSNIAISTDGGTTFSVVDSLGSNDATFWGTDFGNDPLIMASGNKIAVMNNVIKLGSLAGLGLGAQGTTNPDSASGTYLWASTDGGNSWQGDWVILDGDIVISNRPNYEPEVTTYDIGSFTIDAQSVVHIVQSGVNSVGLVGADTINVYPLLYWNDRDKNWMSLELPAVETAAYTSALTWGNVIGAGRPVVKADASGNVVVAMWNRAQFEGEPGNSPINTYPGPTAYYNYDVVYAYSTNGGVTWSTPEIIERNLGNAYMYPNIGGIQIANGEATVHYTYYWDKIPGSNVLGQNAKSVDNVLVYNTVSFPYTPAADIPVTFQVDMGVQAFEGNFTPGVDPVVVRGSFQAAAGDPNGDWQGNMFELADADGDTIYTGTFNIPASFAGTNYEFKYVKAPDGWEVIANNRSFTLTAPAVVNPVRWFSDDSVYTAIEAVTNTIKFVADISGILGVGVGGAFDPNTDSLQVMGLDWDQLGKDITGNRTMYNNDPFNTGIYDATLTVTSGTAAPNGVGDSTKWKFKAYPDGRFANTGWETTPDRWHIYQADGSSIELPAIAPSILPLFGPIGSDVSIQITVDMTGATNRYNGLTIPLNELEFVGMRGAADFLGSWATGGNWTPSDTTTGNMKVLQNIGGNLWRTSVTAPAGTNAGQYAYKFAAMYPGALDVNGGSSPLDNENPNDFNHTFVLSDVSPNITLWTNWSDITTDVKEVDNLVPMVYDLGQNYPNPFNPTTTIKFSIPEAGVVTLKVFNLLGQEVATLLNSEKSSGVYEATFDASTLSSGIYFYTLEAKNFTSTKKMVLLK